MSTCRYKLPQSGRMTRTQTYSKMKIVLLKRWHNIFQDLKRNKYVMRFRRVRAAPYLDYPLSSSMDFSLEYS